MSTYESVMARMDESAREKVREHAATETSRVFWEAIDPLLAKLSRLERRMVEDALTPGVEVLQGIKADNAEDEWKRDA